jgi:acetyltransferase-like isoleucine patch superfamily enzyme
MLWDEAEKIKTGSFCSIAENVVIFGGGEHTTNWISTFPLRCAYGLPLQYRDGLPATKGETEIGNDVWIGYNCSWKPK